MIVLHERRKCVGVVRDGVLYTHNMALTWPRPGWAPCPEDRLPFRLRGGLLAAARRNAAEGGPAWGPP